MTTRPQRTCTNHPTLAAKLSRDPYRVANVGIQRRANRFHLTIDDWTVAAAGDIPAFRSKPTGEEQNDENDQNDANDADPAVTVTVAITAEAAAEATKQEDDQNDNEYESERHSRSPLQLLNEHGASWASPAKPFIGIFQNARDRGNDRELQSYFFSMEISLLSALISAAVLFHS